MPVSVAFSLPSLLLLPPPNSIFSLNSDVTQNNYIGVTTKICFLQLFRSHQKWYAIFKSMEIAIRRKRAMLVEINHKLQWMHEKNDWIFENKKWTYFRFVLFSLPKGSNKYEYYRPIDMWLANASLAPLCTSEFWIPVIHVALSTFVLTCKCLSLTVN